MNEISRIWNYSAVIIIVLLAIVGACKKEEPEPKQIIPTVTTDISDISTTSAICHVEIISCESWSNSSGYQGLRGICWSNINSDPRYTGTNECVGSNSCNFSVILEDLTPGTKYYVRAFAENEIGIGYGNIITFSTLGNIDSDIVFNQDLVYGSLTDVIGNTYKTIEIGSQTWMAENLKTTKLNDGNDIPLIKDQNKWVNQTSPSYCWYLNDEAKYKNTYGALYNWHAVNTGKLCPTGWHVPGFQEWADLASYLGGNSEALEQLRETNTTHWVVSNSLITNSSGFTALPGGTRTGFIQEYYPDWDYFNNLAYAGDFWSTTEEASYITNTILGKSWYFYYDNTCGNWAHEKSAGLSVRCIKD